MLASLGYEEAPSRDEADLILFNTCSIRESADSRFIAHLGEAKRLKGEDPERVVGVGGCWAQSVKDEVFERFPFVDVAFGPGQIHKLAEFLNSDSLTAQGYFEFEDFSGHLPTRREREFQGWLQISQGCNCGCSYCIVPSTRGPRGQPRPGRADRRGRGARRRRGARGDPAGPERQQLRPRPAEASADRLRRAAAPGRRGRRDRPDPLHQPAPEGHEGGRDPRPRRAAGALRADPPAAAVGLERGAETDAPHLRPRALHGPGGADPRARPRLRDHHRHHRRLPRRDRGRLRRRRWRWSRRSATTAPSPSSSRRGAKPRRRRWTASCRTRSRSSGWNGWSRWSSGAPPSGPSASSGGRWRSWSRAPSRTDETRLRGRTRHNKAVNFDGVAEAGRAGRGRDRPARPRRRLIGRLGEARSTVEAAASAIAMTVLAIFGPDRGRQDRGRDRAGGAAARARARIRWRSTATRCRSTRARGADRRRQRRRAGALEHRLLGFVPVTDDFSIGDYMPLAHAEIDAALAAGRTPIVVGGTGLYLRAALAELSLRKVAAGSRGLRAVVAGDPPPDPDLRPRHGPGRALRADRRPGRGDRRRRRAPRRRAAPTRSAPAAPPARRSASTSCSPATSRR